MEWFVTGSSQLSCLGLDCGVVCDRDISTFLFGIVEWFVTGSSQLSCLGLDCGVVCDRDISTFLFGTGLWSSL